MRATDLGYYAMDSEIVISRYLGVPTAIAHYRGLGICSLFDPGVSLRFTSGFMLSPRSAG